MPLSLQLLGGFRLHDSAGREIRVASRKGRALLAYLALRAGDAQSRDRLATLLWEDADEELARASLRQALASIRKCLPDVAQAALLTDANALGLDGDLIDSDIAALRRALSAGTRTALQGILALYRGDLLDGFDARSGGFDEWLTQERVTLRREVAGALQQLTTLCQANDDAEGALNACLRLVALEPLNEAAHRTVMELQARRHAYADALRQYRLCRDILRRELDVAPEPATESLHADLLRRRRATALAGTDKEDEADSGAAPAAPPPSKRAELRDAVVLVVRLEGLLELEASLDPEDSHALAADFHNQVQQAVTEFGGRTDRRVGANVLAVFGIPEGYGNEAERAARAALSLMHNVRQDPPQRYGSAHIKLHLRAGISQGQILHDHELFPLSGRPTHIAHTLAASAPEEAILISSELRHALGERIHAQQESTDAWILQAMRDDSSPQAQPLVGRRPEFAMILAALERCTSSNHGRAIIVRGEAGIGKTRLVDAVRSAARERRIEVHSANVFDFGQSLRRRPITTLALSLLKIGADTPAQRAAAVARVTASMRASIDQIIFLSDLADAPLTDELAALEKAMDPAARQRGRSLALAQLIEQAALRAPQLIVIEDVHWTDQDELARFGEIAAVVARCPILFIMTTRPEGDPISATWRARARGCPVTTLDLAPLAEDEAQEFAARFTELPATVIEACISRAEGNPLFLDQLLRAAIAGHDSLPGSVRTLVVARAGRLGAEDLDALQAAAVLGHRFAFAALRRVMGNEGYEPAALIAAALLRADADELEFSHALFRDAIHESTLRSRRRDLHRRAADWFAASDPALCAEHLAAADDPGTAAAFIVAARAEQDALRFERALTLANKANAHAREPLVLHQTSCLLGELLLLLGRTHDALTAYRESIDFSPDQAGQMQAWLGAAAALRVMDRHIEALDALDRAEAALGSRADSRPVSRPDAQIRARIYTLRGNLCFPLGRLDACLQAHEQALEYAQQAQSPIDLARAYSGIGDAWYQRGRMKTAQGYFARCIEAGRRHSLPGVLIANLPMLGITQAYCGDVRAGTETIREALGLARHANDLRGEMLVHLTTASMLLMRGQADGACEFADQSLRLARQLGARRFQAETLGIIASIMMLRGERDTAANLIAQGLELGRTTGMSYCGPSLLSVFARITSDTQQRARALDEGEALLAAGCVSHSYFEFYSNAIEVSLREAQWARARHYADALALYTREETLQWTQLVIERGNLLADIGEGKLMRGTASSLQRLRTSCMEMDFRMPLAAIEAALAKLMPVRA